MKPISWELPSGVWTAHLAFSSNLPIFSDVRARQAPKPAIMVGVTQTHEPYMSDRTVTFIFILPLVQLRFKNFNLKLLPLVDVARDSDLVKLEIARQIGLRSSNSQASSDGEDCEEK